MNFKNGDVVRLKNGVKTRSKFLHSHSYLTVERIIGIGSHNMLVFVEDETKYFYACRMFEIVSERKMELQKITSDDFKLEEKDIIAKQDFIPNEIDELCNLLSSWNGYIIEKEGIGEW